MEEKRENDRLTFRNHKGEEKTISRQEFRNAARSASRDAERDHRVDHRPRLTDQHIPNLNSGLDYVERATPKERLFQLTHINGERVNDG